MNQPARILVVEDESIVAFNLQQRLSMLGYDVPAIAVSGQESIDLVSQMRPDLVLMDIHIQGDMDGIEVAAKLRETHAVPVIYLTAYSEDSTLERARRTRPYGYLLKPFSERELHATIQMAFERQRLENELNDSRRLLQQALDAASLGVMELDKNTSTITPSPRTADLIGWPRDQPMTLANLLERVDAAERDAIAGKLHDCLENRRHFSEEFRVLAEGATPRWIKIDAGHVSDRRVTGVVQDVSERKQSELRLKTLNESLENLVTARTDQLNQSLKELEAFSYSVAHDLRAPVRAIIGLSEMLVQTQPTRFDPDGIDLVQRIAATGQRMWALIDALLHMARLNQVPMQLRVVDISGIAGEIASQLMESEPQRVAEIRISPKLEAMADPTLVRALLDNLMRNAWKFSAHSKITRIDVGAKTLGGETVFFVRDNGCGFDMASADRLFGPFQRLHRADEYTGTGIGLTIVQRIVMRHGGRVWAFSEPGLGAAFHFTLSA
ncbi:response regulator [Hydrogenophaga sp. NH-16]|uniref:sensor histidine kinase n=1 Tax=Hydrogenophaga sp. NH-16 TaxID=2184519 RepID=UPI000FD9BB87|nr:response regulator [Hydrogenophaga sp. NH-16]